MRDILVFIYFVLINFRDLVHRRWINTIDVDEATTSMGSLLIVEFTPTDVGQENLWSVIERIIGYVNDVRDVSFIAIEIHMEYETVNGR